VSKDNFLSASVLVVCGCFLALAGCARTASQPSPNLPVPVTVAKAVKKTVPLELNAIGTGEAYSSVSIKAQVSAEVMEVHFKEGQDVRKGELLFVLDRRPFEAALAQAQGNLARDKAQAGNAQIQAKRYEELLAQGVASKEQRDQFQSSADALVEAVRADEAAEEYTKVELAYCTIVSPIDGRTGTLMVHVGNLTKAADVPILVVINQIEPLYVDFSVPEQYLGEVKKRMAGAKLSVQALVPGDSRPETGTLSFVDNAVDSTTGTIKLKGTFANADRRLWPGQFVNIVLRLAEQANAIVVPSQAIQTGQSGSYIFVVNSDGVAEQRPVIVGRILGGDAVIEKGIEPEETVVTDGPLRLVSGSKVQARSEAAGGAAGGRP
jgi:multidrug efflux system membrane fusion protein